MVISLRSSSDGKNCLSRTEKKLGDLILHTSHLLSVHLVKWHAPSGVSE